MSDELPPIHVGDHVHDREDDSARMIVVGTPPTPADEYHCSEDETVANYNEDYPADDDVVEIKFAQRTCIDLSHSDSYAYPRSRLQLDEPIHDLEEDN
jgi:hypothetical protein